MDSHPWEIDTALTDRLLKLVEEEDWDLFGIADPEPLNEKARPGRRPKDLWPCCKAVLMFAVGLADPFTRGWVQNGKSGKFYSYALLELARRRGGRRSVKRPPHRCGMPKQPCNAPRTRARSFCSRAIRSAPVRGRFTALQSPPHLCAAILQPCNGKLQVCAVKMQK